MRKCVILYIWGDFMTEEKFCLKDGFVLREIAGEFLAVPVNSVDKFISAYSAQSRQRAHLGNA